MTLEDFLGRLPALGPWKTRANLGLIRNAAGMCPVQAVCRSLGLNVSTGMPGGCASFAVRLGLSEELVFDLQDASDGLAPVYAKVGVRKSEVTALVKLRQRLMAACGVPE